MVQQIKEIEYPKLLKPILREILDRIFTEGKYNEERGEFEIEGLTDDQFVATVYFLSVMLTDELIENLNIVLKDLEKLAEEPTHFWGSPYKRYKFLMRAFFYEWGRFEDIFGYFLLGLEKKQLITKQYRRQLRKGFNDQIEPVKKIRNKMLHDDFRWKGEHHDMLELHETAGKAGMIVAKKGGQPESMEDVLKQLCERRIKPLMGLGNWVHRFATEITESATIVMARDGLNKLRSDGEA